MLSALSQLNNGEYYTIEEIANALKIDCNNKHITAEKRHQGFIKAMKNRSQNEQYCKYLW